MDFAQQINTLWLVVAACLVFLMQAGFLCLEAGLTRTKNAINVAFKNLSDFGISVLLFWGVGFGLMFGSRYIGVTNNFLGDAGRMNLAAFFLFQTVCRCRGDDPVGGRGRAHAVPRVLDTGRLGFGAALSVGRPWRVGRGAG